MRSKSQILQSVKGGALCSSFADLVAKRAALRWLVRQHPEWTQQDLADALKMSHSWVGEWLRRLRQADAADVMALHSRSRARHSPPFSIA